MGLVVHKVRSYRVTFICDNSYCHSCCVLLFISASLDIPRLHVKRFLFGITLQKLSELVLFLCDGQGSRVFSVVGDADP
jgi:hypothetical protein